MSVQLYRDRKHHIDEICQMMGISKPTLYSYGRNETWYCLVFSMQKSYSLFVLVCNSLLSGDNANLLRQVQTIDKAPAVDNLATIDALNCSDATSTAPIGGLGGLLRGQMHFYTASRQSQGWRLQSRYQYPSTSRPERIKETPPSARCDECLKRCGTTSGSPCQGEG